MRKGSLFFGCWAIFCLLVGYFLLPGKIIASISNKVTVSAVVLEHLTYQRTENTLIISTNRVEGITLYNNGTLISGKTIEISLKDTEILKSPFIITANF